MLQSRKSWTCIQYVQVRNYPELNSCGHRQISNCLLAIPCTDRPYYTVGRHHFPHHLFRCIDSHQMASGSNFLWNRQIDHWFLCLVTLYYALLKNTHLNEIRGIKNGGRAGQMKCEMLWQPDLYGNVNYNRQRRWLNSDLRIVDLLLMCLIPLVRANNMERLVAKYGSIAFQVSQSLVAISYVKSEKNRLFQTKQLQITREAWRNQQSPAKFPDATHDYLNMRINDFKGNCMLPMLFPP